MSANSQVADLILQLMRRGQSGGLPMKASPELTQYLAHAQGGTLPPQMHGAQPAPVLPGPGSAMAELRDPNFLAESDPRFADPAMEDRFQYSRALYQQQADRVAQTPNPLDMLTDRPPAGTFRNAGRSAGADDLFIWYTNAKGQRVRLDGPFTNDIEAARALREMRQSGLDPNAQVEIAPDFDAS